MSLNSARPMGQGLRVGVSEVVVDERVDVVVADFRVSVSLDQLACLAVGLPADSGAVDDA